MADERKLPRKVKPPQASGAATEEPAPKKKVKLPRALAPEVEVPTGPAPASKVKPPVVLGAPDEEEAIELGAPPVASARLIEFGAPEEAPSEPEPAPVPVRQFVWTPRPAPEPEPEPEDVPPPPPPPPPAPEAEAPPAAAEPAEPAPPPLAEVPAAAAAPVTRMMPQPLPPRGPRPKAGALVPWFKAMATMMAVGVSLPRALKLLYEQETDPAVRMASMQLVQRLHDGFSLSRAMAREPNVFSHFHLQMVKVGESTGRLHYSLDRLAAYEERRHKLLLQIRHASSYPAIVLSICLVIVVLAPPYLLAGHFKMARESGVELPWITKVLAGFSDLTRDPAAWLALGAVLVVLVPWLRSQLRRPQVQRRLAERALKLRMVGKLLRTMTVARFAQTLAVQLELGVWLSEGLPLAGASTGFPGMEERIARSTEAMLNGAPLSKALQKADFFPRPFLRLVEVGEATGSLPDVMRWISRFYEQEVDMAIDTALTLFEPLLMAGMGILVAVTLLGTMLPMVKVLETL